MKRRDFLLSAGAAIVTSGCATVATKAKPHVVVIGGGYGGATAAKYIRMWSEGSVDVTIVEPNPTFISCPLSNLVLGGSRQLSDLTLSYDGLVRVHGVRLVRGMAGSIDTVKRSVTLVGGHVLEYDRLVVSPGVDFIWDELPGAQDKVLHAWKAGQQTVELRARLAAMPDGGTFVMTIPPAPYRCPPGPYERACQVAHYFSTAKPKSKVLILDANDDVVSKGALFKRIWAQRYPGMIEYRPRFKTVEVDAASNTAMSELGDKVQGALLNAIPPQRAGAIAASAGLASVNQRWCGVNFLTFESTQSPFVHVLGDAIQTSPLMPKSAHMANQHAKVCAAAVVDMLAGRAPNPVPMLTNTCYSFVSDKDVIHVASVHAYSADQKTLLVVPGSGGVSPAESELEGAYAKNWAKNIWADTLF
jgi:NADPH-dependent 2,4-dienoyl-CoA reductase/sulfur reductase-like enzyme